MSKKDKESVNDIILAIEIELNIIDNDIESLEMDINYLKSYRDNLVYNKLFLKKNSIITSMFEYKRTVKELVQVDGKISELNGVLGKLLSKMSIKTDALSYYEMLLEKERNIEARKILVFKSKQ